MFSPSRMMPSASPLLIGALVFIVSCSDDTLNSDPTGPGTMTLDAAAVTNDVTVNEPFDFLVDNPCAADGAGEVIEFTGFAHTLFHFTINGSRVSMTALVQFHISGVGLSTGDQYQSTQAIHFAESGSLVNGQFLTTFVGNAEVTGPGPGNNMYFPATLHVTVNANGEVTAEISKGDFVCK